MNPKRRQRADRLLVDRGLAENGTRARALILAGRVRSAEVRIDKPGTLLPDDAPLAVDPGPRFVSRGGEKLAGAIEELGVAVAGRDAIDVGASTGGFTQVLLEAGATRVIALDVGRGQLDWQLRNDPRVSVREGINARALEPGDLPFRPSLAVVDVSFISLELVLPAIRACLDRDGEMVVLVKPQFEVGRGKVGRGGIVRDPALHLEATTRIVRFCRGRGWGVRGLARSPIRGSHGNTEFFVHVVPSHPGLDDGALARALRAVCAGDVEDPE